MKKVERAIRRLESEENQAVKDWREQDASAAQRMIILLKEWNGREDIEEVEHEHK